ncbi:MAG: hypothetical protein JGK24_08395 [Microcoleus sp. PH2017_29_MFU_D_A]|jgi:ABC-type dipeptide/oligopeptide/nickel transport system permease component|uniref:hypothetical protein n=1 Tax=unclassified Microcoleus TaxID=2642155 RepID=UPI001DE78E4F|nr:MULTISPECIES: hypothetical protein [unclassified Microcoleus]MCC3418869.1 hypothetical protein [Microcoleus sp. PH2017_07_MST_O_A]MCC3433426.1 hypothetical protein [Microcoleus sp. PH2017_04_SCI_O_A]MCC3443583.1 hypothetical protein [Microcoleus sp. PH2017_03_ELD_O_A]MCC3467648.1 hypothetical protein [Microcoleus sp. PH2017_06_SFM_O_A]MCC3504272.1 hypothetical protein [Microcoleus sp. PH2017_19_SFW_U_A]MCC3511714.1 hypothetical protein [Microcoleus sp. PH2017_17_BER_D_A]TAE14075.1 MAG: hy
MSLDNQSNWEVIYSGTHSAAVGLEQGIGRILIPGSFSQHIIRAYASSSVAKPRWWLGGTLTQVLNNGSAQVDFEGSRWQVPLNRTTLISLPELTGEYRIKFEPAPWHKQIQLTLEIYNSP